MRLSLRFKRLQAMVKIIGKTRYSF